MYYTRKQCSLLIERGRWQLKPITLNFNAGIVEEDVACLKMGPVK